VLQAEVIAQRSFKMFAHLHLDPAQERRPAVLGVFLNMLQLGHTASIKVLQQAWTSSLASGCFDTASRDPALPRRERRRVAPCTSYRRIEGPPYLVFDTSPKSRATEAHPGCLAADAARFSADSGAPAPTAARRCRLWRGALGCER